jgi:hypothetical protein
MDLKLKRATYGFDLMFNGEHVGRIKELEEEPWEGYKWAGQPINPEGGEWVWCTTLHGAVAHCIKSKAMRMAADLETELSQAEAQPMVGDPGVRDPEHPCEMLEPGEPAGTRECLGDDYPVR